MVLSSPILHHKEIQMRFLSVAACALAACLLSAGPSQAIVVESHLGGQQAFHVYGEILEPLEINVGFVADVTWPQMGTPETGYMVGAQVGNQLGFAYFAQIRSATGMHYAEFMPTSFWLTDEVRDFEVILFGQVYGDFIINDVYVAFELPNGLSIAAPVPEPSSWALLILGFAGIALIRRYRPSRADTGSLTEVADLKAA